MWKSCRWSSRPSNMLVADGAETMHALMAADRLSNLSAKIEYITLARQICAPVENMVRKQYTMMVGWSNILTLERGNGTCNSMRIR